MTASALDPEAHSGTTAVRDGYQFDEAALTEWMKAHVEGFTGPLEVTQFKGGQSNPTYKLTTPGKTYVLRRKPPGTVLAGAHAVDREARVLQALGTVEYPVAHVHGICTDDAIIGSWFYVMDMVEGRIFWDARLPEVPAADRPAYYDAMNAALAALHQVDYAGVGLGDFGRTGNYVERQVRRWSSQYLGDPEAGRDEHMDKMVAWLADNLPSADETTIVHGDFRIDNVIFHPTEPRILAVLDWELATLGDPLADFAYNAMVYHMPPRIIAGLAGEDLAALNIPSEDQYVRDYCERTGRSAIPGYDFYLAYNVFRLAAIFHGIKGRVLRGTAASASASERARDFPELAEIAWRLACRT